MSEVSMTRRTERILWTMTAAALALAAAWSRPVMVRASAMTPERRAAAVMMLDPARLGAAAAHIAEHDPFRLERRAASVAFGTPDPPPPEAVAASPVRGITLKGVVGPPWRAVLAGVPNRDGNVVVVPGDTLAGLPGFRVRRIRRDTLVFAGPDSLITLTLTRAWQ